MGFQAEELAKLDMPINLEPINALALILHRSQSFPKGENVGVEAERIDPAQTICNAGLSQRLWPDHCEIFVQVEKMSP
jgi:hypothetical protein